MARALKTALRVRRHQAAQVRALCLESKWSELLAALSAARLEEKVGLAFETQDEVGQLPNVRLQPRGLAHSRAVLVGGNYRRWWTSLCRHCFRAAEREGGTAQSAPSEGQLAAARAVAAW